MRIAITGGTGFLGRYIVRRLAAAGHECRLWFRRTSNRTGFEDVEENITWSAGTLGDPVAAGHLIQGCDAVVHAALDRPGMGFRGAEGNLIPFVEKNVVGSLQLMEEARAAKVHRFIYISTCAVHEKILDDRPLDETHPLWPLSHYGAHKAAVEKFIHAMGYGAGVPVCALRPTGIYGFDVPPANSKWFKLIQDVVAGRDVCAERGGKEVHAADVAKAVEILLTADGVAGESYSCYDRYVSDYEVATLAKEISGSAGAIHGSSPIPKHQIVTDKIRGLGMEFGGSELLAATVRQLVEVAGAAEETT